MSGKRSYQDEQLEEANKRQQMVDTLLRGSEDKDGDDGHGEASVYDDLLQDPEEVENENKQNREQEERESGSDVKNEAKGGRGEEEDDENVDLDPSVTAVARAAQHASQRRHGDEELEDEDEDEEEEEEEEEEDDEDHVDIDDVDKDPDAVIEEDEDEDEDRAGHRRGVKKAGEAGGSQKSVSGLGDADGSALAERANDADADAKDGQGEGQDQDQDQEQGEGEGDGADGDGEGEGEGEGDGDGDAAGGAAPRRGRKPGQETGSNAWKQQRKESHKEVERRRRQNINTAIEKLSDLLPVKETSKAAILSRAAEYIQKMKETESANIEKWTLQKLLGEQQVSSLTSANDKLEQELSKAYKNLDELKKKLKEAGIDDPTEEH